MPSKECPFSFILAVPVIQNTWPSGSYGLPKPRSGCPNKQWREGFRYQDSENLENINFKSNGSHFSGKVSLHGIRQEFCIHMDTPGAKISWPRGKYCIYRKGKTCPTGLQEGMALLSHIDVCCFQQWIRPQQGSVVFTVIGIQSLNLFHAPCFQVGYDGTTRTQKLTFQIPLEENFQMGYTEKIRSFISAVARQAEYRLPFPCRTDLHFT